MYTQCILALLMHGGGVDGGDGDGSGGDGVCVQQVQWKVTHE